MNDCIWCFTCVCEGTGCRECKDYVSINCELGGQMLEAYGRDIEEAIAPVRDKWARKKGER